MTVTTPNRPTTRSDHRTEVVPLTLENATKFSGALWLARTMFRRIDSLRAFAVLRLMSS